MGFHARIEVMNDKGIWIGIGREEFSGVLVSCCFSFLIDGYVFFLFLGILRSGHYLNTSGKLPYLNRRLCSQDFFSPSQSSSHDGCNPFP